MAMIGGSYYVGKVALRPLEIQIAQRQQNGDHDGAGDHGVQVRWRAAQDDALEGVDDAGQRVEGVQGVERIGPLARCLLGEQFVLDQLQRVDDRGNVHQQGEHHRQGGAHVAVVDVDGGAGEGDGERREDGVGDDEGHPQHVDAGHHLVPHHQPGQDDEVDAQFHQLGEHRGDGENLAREVDFLDQRRVADDAGYPLGSGFLKEGPGHERGEHQDGVGNVAAVDADKALHQGKDQHEHDRLEDGPGDAQVRLLVAQGDVLPRERGHQFAVVVEVFGDGEHGVRNGPTSAYRAVGYLSTVTRLYTPASSLPDWGGWPQPGMGWSGNALRKAG